ncbi:MAG: hemerythrin domain-containing protein [Xanthomonadales bacterium]|nr:hemerythrin domain-containing protein [Xanthomonadales bacterium]ODU94827.1 MAG: hypothetical protein ABT18_02400 [Rhodanobacter sp. SCN 66-43]OJY82814.1 MAG: hypothetical protein BGP23_06860 [Xanthomonadales bacterium 66-474]
MDSRRLPDGPRHTYPDAPARHADQGNTMGSFRQLLAASDAVPAPPVAVRVRAGKIQYDPRLLDSLLRDHVELGRLFGRIGAAGNAGEARELRSLLITFKARLKAHLVVENMRFYDYLEQSLADEPETARMVLNFRRKMTRIASDVFDFIQKYQSSRLTPGERRQFTPDYETVGAKLEQRLDSEEDNLYRLYRPR